MGNHKTTKRKPPRGGATKSVGPARPSSAHSYMSNRWAQMDSILGGTEAMRAAGRTYLPQHLGEENDRYKERLTTATLWNQTELTLNGWVGRPFRDPLKLMDDVPEQIRALEEDIDSEGSNMDAFAREWFRKGLAKASCHVLVDAPAFDTPDGRAPTLEEERLFGLRPYWILIDPSEVIAARQVKENGRDVITHLRLYEAVLEPDPVDQFNEILVERIRVFDRVLSEDDAYHVQVTIYLRQKNNQGKATNEWAEEVSHPDNGRIINFPQIPLVTFYSNREGFMRGKSPLQDLCDMNVKHWQKLSDHDNIIRVASFPMLAGSGVNQEEGIEGASPRSNQRVIGPYTLLTSEDASGKFYYVEHTGKAIKSGVDSLDSLEAKMAAYGSEFLKKKPDRQTATARAMDSAEATSPLQDMTLRFKEAFQRALAITAQMMGIAPENPDTEFFAGQVQIVTDFGPEEISGIDLNALITARANRDISRNTFLKELQRRGILPEDFDEESNVADLEQEMLEAFGGISFPNKPVEEPPPDEGNQKEPPPDQKEPSPDEQN